MARPEKVAVVEEVRGELADNPATLLTEYRGLTVSELAELRTALREAGARYVVVKNTLARIAARDAGFEALEEMLTGPTALTFCDDDPVGPAKALRSFAKDHPELVVKGGILEGRIVDAETADKLADLESREDLLGRLAGMLYGALANAASLFQAPVTEMARLVAALEEEGEAPAGEPDEAATDDEPEAEATEDDAEAGSADAPEEVTIEDDAEAGSADAPEEVTIEADAASGSADEPDAEPEPADEPEAEEDPAEATSDAVEAVTGVAAEAVEAAGDAAASAAEAAGETVGGSDPAETVASAVENAAETASGAVSAAGQAAGNAVGAVVDAVTDGGDEDDETVDDDQGDQAEASETSDEDDAK